MSRQRDLLTTQRRRLELGRLSLHSWQRLLPAVARDSVEYQQRRHDIRRLQLETICHVPFDGPAAFCRAQASMRQARATHR